MYTSLKLKDQRHENEDGGDYLINDVASSTKGGISLYLADRFMGILYASVMLIVCNLVSALLQLDIHFWKYGIYFWFIVLVLSIFAFNDKYLDDFKEFKSWSENESRKFAIITLGTVSGIFLALISSLAWYISIAINNSR